MMATETESENPIQRPQQQQPVEEDLPPPSDLLLHTDDNNDGDDDEEEEEEGEDLSSHGYEDDDWPDVPDSQIEDTESEKKPILVNSSADEVEKIGEESSVAESVSESLSVPVVESSGANDTNDESGRRCESAGDQEKSEPLLSDQSSIVLPVGDERKDDTDHDVQSIPDSDNDDQDIPISARTDGDHEPLVKNETPRSESPTSMTESEPEEKEPVKEESKEEKEKEEEPPMPVTVPPPVEPETPTVPPRQHRRTPSVPVNEILRLQQDGDAPIPPTRHKKTASLVIKVEAELHNQEPIQPRSKTAEPPLAKAPPAEQTNDEDKKEKDEGEEEDEEKEKLPNSSEESPVVAPPRKKKTPSELDDSSRTDSPSLSAKNPFQGKIPLFYTFILNFIFPNCRLIRWSFFNLFNRWFCYSRTTGA